MKKRFVAMLTALTLCLTLLCPSAFAALAAEGQYWKNLDGAAVQPVLDRGLEGGHEPIIVLYYSRHCGYSQRAIPLIREYAETHGITVYGLDAFTDGEGYKIFFGGNVSGGYPIAVCYWGAGGAPQVVPGIRSVEAFEKLMGTPKPEVSPDGFEITSAGTLLNYHGFAASVVIPDSVKVIGDSAFKGNKTLESVVIPNSVTSIGANAFSGCEALTRVSMSGSVTELGESVFRGCYALENVILSPKVTKLPRYAFASCQSLKDVELPAALTAIDTSAFYDCRGLLTLTIPTGVTSIGTHAFGSNPYRLHTIQFLGHKPEMPEGENSPFYNVYAAVLYPKGDSTWNPEALREQHPDANWDNIPGKNRSVPSDYYLSTWNDGTISSWARDSIYEVYLYNLQATGLRKNYNQPVTRKDFCDVLMRVVTKHTGIDIVDYDSTLPAPFTDTASKNVYLAYYLGLVSGKGEGLFDPNGLITRQEAASMLTRAARFLGLDHSAVPSSFADSGDIAGWAIEGVDYISSVINPVTGNAVMNGTGNRMFSPRAPYTLEQAYITCLSLYQALAAQQFPDHA